MDNREKIIKYRFTAYLMKSVKTYRVKYLQKKELQMQYETLVSDFGDVLPDRTEPSYDNLMNLDSLQNDVLDKALKKIKERDLHILLLHLLEEYSLREISTMLNINYNTVLSIYTRTIKKIQKEMGDDENRF